jgi:hypothetical protein
MERMRLRRQDNRELPIAFSPGLRPVDFRSLRFVLSHPFARNKANGWGTELLWETIAWSHY